MRSDGQQLKLLAPEDEDTGCQERGLCSQTDPEAFFPDKGGSTKEAKKICVQCEVRDECLQYAIDHDERFGVWGGLTERERRALRRAPAQALPVSGEQAAAPSPSTTTGSAA